jgi:hypothetical protein
MDIVYYSNYCKHSQKLLQYLAKHGLTSKVNCINIDKRKRDNNTNQTHIYLENGGIVLLPPNVHCVPALLLVNEKYRVVIGEEIYRHFQPKVSAQTAIATKHNNEPESYVFSSSQPGINIQSEQYTFYNMSPDELSAKGKGGMRQLYNYVSAFHDNMSIQTPPETYRPDKVSSETVEALQQMRSAEMSAQPSQSPQGAAQVAPPVMSPNPLIENKYIYTQQPSVTQLPPKYSAQPPPAGQPPVNPLQNAAIRQPYHNNQYKQYYPPSQTASMSQYI